MSESVEDEETGRPNAARMYDYYLGGSHNFAADREAADAVEAAWPGAKAACWENRGFLRRAVRFVAEQGCDQFLDLGSGVPTVGNVHEVAQAVNPAAHVVYVDSEAVAYQAARRMLAGSPTVDVVQADLRDTAAVLGDPRTAALLDFSRPVAVLMVSVLHFVPGDVAAVVAAYRKVLVPGSFLVVSHATPPWELAGSRADMEAAYRVYESSSTPLHYRAATEIEPLFAGTELLPPGLVHVMDWRPDLPADPARRARIGFLAAVARSPRGPARPPPSRTGEPLQSGRDREDSRAGAAGRRVAGSVRRR